MVRFRQKRSRAALRARSRRSQRRGAGPWFPTAVAIVCVAGVLGVLFLGGIVTGDDEASAAPSPPTEANPAGDHWHAAFGVNVCGEWLGVPPEFETAADNPSIRVGIHTHGDGFIHIHPFTSAEGGDNATLGRFFDYAGWSVSQRSIDVWAGPSTDPTKTRWKDGDRCPADSEGGGKPGRVVFEVNCKSSSGDPADHKLADQEVVAIGFLPEGAEMGTPPTAESLPSLDGGTTAPFDQGACRPSGENNPGLPSTTTTAAVATTTTTTTTTTP